MYRDPLHLLLIVKSCKKRIEDPQSYGKKNQGAVSKTAFRAHKGLGNNQDPICLSRKTSFNTCFIQ